MPQTRREPPGESLFLAAAILATFWIGGAFAYMWGYFRTGLFKLPADELAMLLAWLVVPAALIAACAGLIHEIQARPRSRRKRQPLAGAKR